MSKLISGDLDRCPHGRHQKDQCLDCEGQARRGVAVPENSLGLRHLPNPHLDQVIGYRVGGVPFTARELLDDTRQPATEPRSGRDELAAARADADQKLRDHRTY